MKKKKKKIISAARYPLQNIRAEPQASLACAYQSRDWDCGSSGLPRYLVR